MADVKPAPDTKVVIGPIRFSYLHVWEPKASEEGGEKKYSASIIIPKSEKGLIAKINQAIEVAKQNGKALFGGKIPGNLKTPLRDGDIDRPEDEAYAGCIFFNASSKNQPGIVDKDRNPIMKQEEVYSGCYGYVSVNFYPFNKKSMGVAAGLNHIMKTKDGEPLSGRSSAEEDFADLVVVEDDASDLL